jgi:hypothetical protein
VRSHRFRSTQHDALIHGLPSEGKLVLIVQIKKTMVHVNRRRDTANVLVAGTSIFGDRKGVAAAMKRLHTAVNTALNQTEK